MGIEGINIVAFLLACKMAGMLDRGEMRQIIDGLARLDYYRFRDDVLGQLLN